MSETAFAAPVGIYQKPKILVRIRCGCRAIGFTTDAEIHARHGHDANGSILPCPNPLEPEHLGRADEMSEMVRGHGCNTWDEFAAKHPITSKLFLKRNLLRGN